AMIMQSIDEPRSSRAELDPNATFGVKITAKVPDTPAAKTARLADSIATYMRGITGARKKVSIQQLLQLLRALPEPLRNTVLRAVTGVLAGEEDATSLRDFAAELPPEDVLDALQLLAGTQKLSQHALTLLRALIQTKQKKTPGPVAPDVAEDLVMLFGDEDIDRFNPPDHQALLNQITIDVPYLHAPRHPISELGTRVDTVTDDVLHRQLAQTLLELLATQTGDPEPVLARIESLFRGFLDTGRFVEALEVVERLRELNFERSIERLADVETIHSLVERMHSAPPEMVPFIQKLAERMGLAASHMLLVALAEEQNLGRRRRLFDFAVSLGPAIVPAATRFLNDDRWFVVRNVIILLRSVNDRTSLPEGRRCAHHEDLRVRIETITDIFALDYYVPSDILHPAHRSAALTQA